MMEPGELPKLLRRKHCVLHDADRLHTTLELVNPDGPAAADALEAALLRISELELALEPLALLAGGDVNMNDPLAKWFTVGHLANARAVLSPLGG